MKGLPSSIDVEKFAESRAFEIQAMQQAMKNAKSGSTHRAWQELPRHLRRRAASHDVRRVPSRLRQKSRAEMDPMRRKALGRSHPRRGKARQEPRSITFLKRQQDKKWLESHLWHAKRMKMENMWGYRLAVQPTEKSFRPSHRASVHGSILHDASYYGLIELSGPEHVLKTLLESCCDLQGQGPGAKRFLTGVRACETSLYGVNSYPFEYIGPIQLIWQALTATSTPDATTQHSSQPLNSNKENTSKRRRKKSNKGKEPEAAPVNLPGNEVRKVWVRCHPTIFKEVLWTLKTAISLTLEDLRRIPEHAGKVYEVMILDLRDAVNVFEIMGPKSSQVIKGALTPLLTDKRDDFKKFWSSLSDLQTTGSVPSNMIIGFTVMDPRLNFPPKNAKPHVNKDALPSISASYLAYPTTVLAQGQIWDETLRHSLRVPRFKKKELDARRAQNVVPSTPLTPTRPDNRVPILLIQRSVQSTAIMDASGPQQQTNDIETGMHGWTLIVPQGWSMPFLNSLIYTGTRVGGQRERAHQSFEAGVPYFPRDFPGSAAYKQHADERMQADKERWDKKPPAKRPNWEKLGTRSPWVPDWRGVLGLPPAEEDGADGLVSTQRDEVQDALRAVRTWLLRGPDVRTILGRVSKMFNAGGGLWLEMNALRAKRGMAPLGTNASAEVLLKGALVPVRISPLGRGCPDDLAIIYSLDDRQALAWKKVEDSRKRLAGALLDDVPGETELSAVVPSEDAIIGYVTSGNFSLSRGQGHGIGAIAATRFFELHGQAEILHLGEMLVLVRDRDGTICRAACIGVLDV
ncbi:POP1-domain-containing protein [Artomyces pyxidatus]|uniref:POP1-domain-containing protein n=1 Tax=Artomyces pyxidatus TaxID=48021 RepID=A0ACB8SSX3_9AGAM|nr:POP1-domain-containing protein [Artomyces pyxidatus]